MTCLWIGCDQAPSRRGICSRHYQRTLAAGMKASKPIPVSVPERLDELAHLLWGGEWPTRAAQRCGWTLSGAESAARYHGRHDILSSLMWERSYVEGARWTVSSFAPTQHRVYARDAPQEAPEGEPQ